MRDTPQTTLDSHLTNDVPQLPWWKMPVWGKGSFIELMTAKLRRPEVSESSTFLHNREMEQALNLAKSIQALDNEKFSNKEFILFIKVKYCLARGVAEYEGLDQSVQLLKVAIEAKNSFLSIDQTELLYRGSKQQQFYEFVLQLLNQNLDKDIFREQIQGKLTEIIPQVKTNEGKLALQSYAQELDSLSEHELGLKLLSLFKAYQLADYSILRIISDLVNSLGEKDLLDLKSLISLVMVKFEVFEKIRQIIGVSEKRNTPDTYARMVHYIALGYRHQNSFSKFDELMKFMRRWYQHYQAIQGIRQEHPAHVYKQPKEFSQPIPGIELYNKYVNWLTDQKTGMVYVDFDGN